MENWNKDKVQQLTAENERLKEMIGVCIVTLKCDLVNLGESQERQVSEEFNRGRQAGLTYAIEMLLAYAGYNRIQTFRCADGNIGQ